MNLEDKWEALRGGYTLRDTHTKFLYRLSGDKEHLEYTIDSNRWFAISVVIDVLFDDDRNFEILELRPKLERDYIASNIELLGELELGFQRLLREISSPETMMSDEVDIPFAHDAGQRVAYNQALEMVQSRKRVFELRSKERE